MTRRSTALPCPCSHDGCVSHPCGQVGQLANVSVPGQGLRCPQGLLLKRIPFASLQYHIFHPQMGLQGSHSVQEPAHSSWIADIQLYTESSSPLAHHRDLTNARQHKNRLNCRAVSQCPTSSNQCVMSPMSYQLPLWR